MEPLRRYGKLYLIIIAAFTALALMAAAYTQRTTSVSAPGGGMHIWIDPGHGGEDGGALAPCGRRESEYNLEISLRLRDLLRLCGMRISMTREADCALYDRDCATISQKKASDLRSRAQMIRRTPEAIVLSIHLNHFPEAKYRGAQCFYNGAEGSKALAEAMQNAVRCGLDPDNHRGVKSAGGIYLMEHIPNTAVLIECGFLSNPDEESLLRTPAYQRRLCCALCAGLLTYAREETLL